MTQSLERQKDGTLAVESHNQQRSVDVTKVSAVLLPLLLIVLLTQIDNAVQQIRFYQQNEGLILSTKAIGVHFGKIVADIGEEQGYSDTHGEFMKLRIGKAALQLIQEAAEEFIVKEFQQAVLAQIHAERFTLMEKDLLFVQDMRYLRYGYRILPREPTTRETRDRLRALYQAKKNKRGRYSVEMENKRAREAKARRQRWKTRNSQK